MHWASVALCKFEEVPRRIWAKNCSLLVVLRVCVWKSEKIRERERATTVASEVVKRQQDLYHRAAVSRFRVEGVLATSSWLFLSVRHSCFMLPLLEPHRRVRRDNGNETDDEPLALFPFPAEWKLPYRGAYHFPSLLTWNGQHSCRALFPVTTLRLRLPPRPSVPHSAFHLWPVQKCGEVNCARESCISHWNLEKQPSQAMPVTASTTSRKDSYTKLSLFASTA